MREADDPDDRRGPSRRRGGPARRPDLPHQHLVPLRGRFYGFGTDVRPIKKVVQNGLLGWPLKVTVSGDDGLRLEVLLERPDLRSAPSRCPRSSITTSGSAPRPRSPTTRTASTAPSAAIGTTTAAGWATWACTTSTRSSTSWTKTRTARWRSRPIAPNSIRTPAAAGGGSELKYADGCEIVLDGENRDTDAPFIEGPKGRLYRGLRVRHPELREKLAALPDPEPQVTDFVRAVRTRRTIRPERSERPPLLHARQPGQDRRPARPAAPLRPGARDLPRRRRGQPPREPAHAGALASLERP